MQGPDPLRRRDGDAADPDAVRAVGPLPSLSSHVGKHLGVNGDHVAAIELNPGKVRDVLGLPGYDQFYKGRPITVMSYDHWVGRRAHRLRRHPVHASGDPALPAHELPLRRRQIARGCPFVVGAPEEALDLDLVKPHRDPGHGGGHERRHVLRRSAGGRASSSRTAGRSAWASSTINSRTSPLASARRRTRRSRQSASGGGSADSSSSRRRPGVYAAHPLGGCRMADSADLGVVDHRCEVFG